MKNVCLVIIALFCTMQFSAQNLGSLTKTATEATSSSSLSSSLIDGLAADQVKKLTKKLNLNESQQEQVSGLVVSQLKSEKFQKLLGSFGASSLTGATDEQKDKVTEALYSDPDFKEGLNDILDDNQKKTLSSSLSKG